MSDIISNTLKLAESVIESQQREIEQLQRELLAANTINNALIAMVVANVEGKQS
jgi:hypothetical protein